jgi:hypothetical protein
MTDLPVPAIEPPVPSNDLAVLAGQINDEHDEVVKAIVHGADHAIRAGKLLLAAKIAARHGDWSEWLATNCRVSERSAQLYMQLAREFPQGLAGVSLTAAIKMLEPLKSPEEKLLSGPRPKSAKKNHVAEAIKAAPLSILEKAWEAASDAERNIFMTKVSVTAQQVPPVAVQRPLRPES